MHHWNSNWINQFVITFLNASYDYNEMQKKSTITPVAYSWLHSNGFDSYTYDVIVSNKSIHLKAHITCHGPFSRWATLSWTPRCVTSCWRDTTSTSRPSTTPQCLVARSCCVWLRLLITTPPWWSTLWVSVGILAEIRSELFERSSNQAKWGKMASTWDLCLS